MKTIAQLKRDAKSGEYKGRMIIRNGNYNIPERLNGWRKIVDSNTKSIFFLNNEGKKSELQLPKATLVEYTDNLLTIYNPGERELNENEKQVMNEWEKVTQTKEYKEKSLADIHTDSDMTFWKKIGFFRERDMIYLTGTETVRGMKYNAYNGKVIDDNIRGNICMQYEIRRG